MELGYSHPEIKKIFGDLLAEPKVNAIDKDYVPIGTDMRHLEVYEVPLDLPRYRLSNTRTIAMQQKYIADKNLNDDYFEKNILSDELQKVQHEILSKLIDRKDLKEYFKKNIQTDPLIVTRDGFVVSGNRRLCAFRELYYGEGGQAAYKKFERIKVLILPICKEEEIEYIEDFYEQQEDVKDEFTWYNKAIGFRRRIAKHKYSTKILSQKSGIKESEIKKLLQSLIIAESYLEEIEKPKDFEFVEKDQLALERFEAARKKIQNHPSQKSLFQKLSFVSLKNQEKFEGRMYDNIPLIQESLDEIENEIYSEFEDEIAKVNSEKTSLNPLNDPTISSDRSEEIYNFLESDIGDKEFAIVEIVADKVIEKKFEKQDKNKKKAVFKNVVKAHKALVQAYTNRLKDSDKEGVMSQIINIEKILKDLKSWATDD
jgi:hypothetical protein